jgi:hypothetical protein
MRAFCNGVRAIVSDFGAEHFVVDVPDILIEFLQAIGVTIPARFPRQTHLFPKGLLAMGWHHCVDGLVRYGLYLLPWFPQWLAALKLVLKFFRNCLKDLTNKLTEDGCGGAAWCLDDITFPTFAQWRWRKMRLCAKSVHTALGVLEHQRCLAILKDVLRETKDTEVVKAMCDSAWNATFKIRLKFVFEFSDRLYGLESFGSSCICHQYEWLMGIPYECVHRGRVLPMAWDFVQQHMTDWGGEDF